MCASFNNNLTLAEMEAASLASLDAAAGKPRPDLAALRAPDSYAGSEWFAAIYDTPFGELDDEHFTRVCRQDWERGYILPLAIARLQTRPFVGIGTDTDLLWAVGRTGMNYWNAHPQDRINFCHALDYALSFLKRLTDYGWYDIPLFKHEAISIMPEDKQMLLELQARLCREA